MKNIFFFIFSSISLYSFCQAPLNFEEIYSKQTPTLQKKLRHKYQSFLTNKFYNGIYCCEVGDGYDDIIEKECQRVLFLEQEHIFKDRWYKNFIFSFDQAKMNGRDEKFDVYTQRYNMSYGEICDFSIYINTDKNKIIKYYEFSIYCD